MITFIIFIGLVIPSFAQSNSTALEGWQFDDDSRSSWDILWTCLSTILACTWTALHISAPKRDESDNAYTFWKIVGWIFAILAPELMAGVAAEELCRARAVVARCNDALCKLSNESTRLVSPPMNTPEIEEQGCDGEATSPEKAASTQETEASIRDKPQAIPQWSTVQGYCLTMNGVLLQTQDGWTYPVQPNNVVQLIEAGIVKHFHLRSRDIEDRAKADSLAKLFTLLQSLWVICNIIARRAYDLPVSPLEYSTVAYVACAAVTYITWWHKPKDMVTPILIFLPYVKDGTDMPLQIRKTLDEGHGSWVRLPDAVDGDFLRWLKAAAHLLRLPFTVKGRKLLIEGFTKGYADVKQELSNDDPSPVNDRPQDEEIAQPSKLEESQRSTSKVRNPPELLSIGSYINLANLYMFVALLFCGIHVAA
ncbi:hypothetical protein N7490_005730 [Penicillium lividum]|nr:hypothetical protein N7490_005730 [Penicillium lividum]